MFERFTRGARDAVVRAQELARADGASQITSGYLVLGAVDSPAGVAARALTELGVEPSSFAQCLRTIDADTLDPEALAAVGIDLDEVRAQVEATFGPGALDAPADGDAGRQRSSGPGRVPFDPAAKKLLEVALREAVRFTSNRIDTGHLLLAAARLDGTAGQRALAWFGHDRAAVERAVVAAWAADAAG